ncbi:MAG: ATP-binding cassette domain-containing protein [Proteobacteria bacterium]|nr:ATP-binding cassette domain-containing protein [Pseudomonadota bacterium]NBY19729.1 ATP-binding cassette domain-containing protein [bacterium]
MIEVKDLTKNYGDRLAVDNISFCVKRGEILGFLGQNGAGKSTTMKILTCFMPATSGTASVAGFDVFENPYEVKKRIGYLPENPPIYLELLVSEYLDFVANLRKIPSSNKKKKINAVIERCQLGDVRNRLIGNLSKGYRQRVGLAQALIHDPEVLILDEPTVGLDPKQVSEARGLIKSLRSERTVIYSTHILSEVAATCDRIIVIDRGKIVAQEAINSLGAAGATTKTELIVQRSAESVAQSLRSLQGVKSVHYQANGKERIVVETEPREEIMAEIAKVVVNNNAGLIQMSPVQLALEDYYLNLISGKRGVSI